jgi:voltage-gated potassium channel
MPKADLNNPRLDSYVAATTRSMVIISLSVVPMYVIESILSNAGNPASWVFLVGGILVQITMATDLAIRMVLSRRPLGYLLHHKLDVVAIVIPPLRAVGQVAGVRGVLRRKGVLRFTVFSGLLVSAAAFVVYGAERSSPEATIDSLSDAIWWAIVTTTTIGYGDVVPVTQEGRAMAVVLMMLGIVILAVATANVSAYFVDGRRDSNNDGTANTVEVLERLARLEASIANIEAHLLSGRPAADASQESPTPADE